MITGQQWLSHAITVAHGPPERFLKEESSLPSGTVTPGPASSVLWGSRVLVFLPRTGRAGGA